MPKVTRPALMAAINVLAATACLAQQLAPSSTAPPSGFSPWGGTLMPEGVPHQPGLLPARRAPANSSWLNQSTPAASMSPIQSQPVGVVATEPFTPQPYDAVYIDQLQPLAPPEIRAAGVNETTAQSLSQMSPQPQGPLPPGARDGVFQKIYVIGTWLPAIENEPDALGFGDFETGVVLGFPFTRRDTPLLVTPQAGVHFLENAGALDLPTELYDAAIELRHLRKFGGGPWAMDVAATVGYYSDFDQSSSEAVRVSGRAIGVYESSPSTKWLLGVAYANRAGASVLPVAGLIYEPTPDVRLDLIFPRPKVSWRTPGSVTGDEGWLYVGGEFGGGVWSITRPSSGDLDVLYYSDWRVLAGYERKITGGLSRRFEAGYVFNRDLEFDSATRETSLDDTLFLRAGLTY